MKTTTLAFGGTGFLGRALYDLMSTIATITLALAGVGAGRRC
jgi:hypothetical protein